MISKLPTRSSSKVILLEKQQWVANVTRKSWDWTGEDPFLTGHCLIDPQTHPTGSLYFAESAQYIFTHVKKSSWQPLNLNNFLNNGYLKMIVLVWSIILLFKFAQLEMEYSPLSEDWLQWSSKSDDIIKINFWNYGICWDILKEKHLKDLLAKN